MQAYLQPFFIMTLPPEVPLTLKSQGVQSAFISTLATVPDAFKLLPTTRVPFVLYILSLTFSI